MDLETLTLVKLLLVAGLAWLSLRKVRRMEANQLEIKNRHESGILQEMPIIERIKLKDESCLSTSAASKTQVTYQEYNSIYDKFWVENNNQKKQDNRMDIEQPLKINQLFGVTSRCQQNPPLQTRIDTTEFVDYLESQSSDSYQYRPKDITKRIKSKQHRLNRLKGENQGKYQKCTLNYSKKTIVKLNKSNTPVCKNR